MEGTYILAMNITTYYESGNNTRPVTRIDDAQENADSLVTGLPTLTRFGSRDKMAVVLERIYSACFSVNLPSLKKCCFINSTLGTT